MKKQRFTFPKKFKLCSQKRIEKLSHPKNKQSILVFPLLLKWNFLLIDGQEKTSENKAPFQLVISVSKKKFKRAVDRNRIKRLIRESFRLHIPQLLETLANQTSSLDLMCIYVANEEVPFASLLKSWEKAMIKSSLMNPIKGDNLE